MTRRGIVLFAILSVAWGIPYLFIKIALEELEPATIVLGRTALAALILMPVALLRRQIAPVLRRWRPLLAFTLIEIVIPWFFLNSAEQHVDSSTAGLLIAAVPLVGVGAAFLFGRPARFAARNWVGILAGMLGVAALVGLDVAGSELIGVLELAVVVVGYAVAPLILSRWMSDLPGLGVMACAVTIAAMAYLPFVLLTGAMPAAVPSPRVIAAIGVLGIVSTALAFIVMFALVAEIGPVRMTAITYVNPAVAIAAGALVLGEEITVWTVVGFALVLAGSYLVTYRRGGDAATGPAPVTGPVPVTPPEPRS